MRRGGYESSGRSVRDLTPPPAGPAPGMKRAEPCAPRWTIQRQEGETFCEDEHPVRLGRNPKHYPGEPWQRAEAIRDGKKGYRCPGGEVHLYPLWIVYDANDDRTSNAGAFDVYKEAVACRDRLIERDREQP